MNVLILCPHVRISGGVKVIFRLAEGLMKNGIKVCLAVTKYKHKYLLWYPHAQIPFNIVDIHELSAKDFNKYDCVINYGDGPPLTQVTTKKVLFLQGLASKNKAAESINLGNNYNMIIATSKWLHDVAVKIGHDNVHIVPPGIDRIFKPISREENRIPVIGALFHDSPEKQFNLFLNTIHRLFIRHNLVTHSMVLSARPIKGIQILDTLVLPYSLIVNPHQSILPTMYSACDVWLSTSKNEGFGLPPLEAMACNVPVIWYPNLGLHSYTTEKNCIIARNPQEASTAVTAILSDPTLKNKLIENGTELAAKFTWENSVTLFAACLRSL